MGEKEIETMKKNLDALAGAVQQCDLFLKEFEDKTPKIKEVAMRAFELGVMPIIAVIVRDRNINELQQVRVGGECTMDTALEYY